jgi:probable aminopeptidase NPEPL1
MSRNLKPTHMLDMATLTGAQMMNTGMHHAAVLSSDPAFEQVVFHAGQASGDWVFPILYAPELVRSFHTLLLCSRQ